LWGRAHSQRFNNSDNSSNPTYAAYSTLPKSVQKGTSPNAEGNLGKWKRFAPNMPNSIVRNLYFSRKGGVHYER